MRGFVVVVMMAVVFSVGAPTLSGAADAGSAGVASPAHADAQCEHGVAQRLCARCNPKLAGVYKAKGDWCGEHARPESQCVICHPELAKKGVK